MCWDKNCDKNAVMGSVKAGAPWVLGFNEPDMCGNGGSCQSPAAVHDAWGNAMFPFKRAGAKIVCPAITSNDTPGGPGGFASGLAWLDQFAHHRGSSPADVQCDAQALHWYGVAGKSGAEQGDLFVAYVKHAHDRVNAIFGRSVDLWITEFAPLPVADANVMADFLNRVVPFLDGADYVSRYSPFKAESLISNGKPNAAGNAFIAAH